MGSAAKSARRIVSRIGSAPDGAATPQQVTLSCHGFAGGRRGSCAACCCQSILKVEIRGEHLFPNVTTSISRSCRCSHALPILRHKLHVFAHAAILACLQNAAGGGADSDVRLVYVSTHAEGVTRVLCFSDAKDQYTRDAYAEDAAGLTRRLAQLDEHLQVRICSKVHVMSLFAVVCRHASCILCCFSDVCVYVAQQEVNAELDQLEDSSNLDMSLITDAPSRRHQRSPSLTSRLSATLSTRSSTSEGAQPDPRLLQLTTQNKCCKMAQPVSGPHAAPFG